MGAFERFQFHLTEMVVKVDVNPNAEGLPGIDAFQKLLNGAAALALLGCVAAFVIGAVQYGLGGRAQNYSHAADGRERMLKSVAGAFGIGAVAAVVNFFYGAGTGVH